MGHVAERMCCVCRQRGPRIGLIRIVAREGSVEVDERGNAPGRGVYLHRSGPCRARSLEKRAIERALRLPEGSVAIEKWQVMVATLAPHEGERKGKISRGAVRLKLRGGE